MKNHNWIFEWFRLINKVWQPKGDSCKNEFFTNRDPPLSLNVTPFPLEKREPKYKGTLF